VKRVEDSIIILNTTPKNKTNETIITIIKSLFAKLINNSNSLIKLIIGGAPIFLNTKRDQTNLKTPEKRAAPLTKKIDRLPESL